MKKKRGRPRINVYVPISVLLEKFETFKCQWLNTRNQYRLFHLLVFNLYRVVFPQLNEKYHKIGEAFMIRKRGKYDFWDSDPFGEFKPIEQTKFLQEGWDPGKDVIIDLRHHPPRLRVTLKKISPLLDIPLKCPVCASISQTKKKSDLVYDNEEQEIFCENGHVNWKIDVVERYLREMGFLKK